MTTTVETPIVTTVKIYRSAANTGVWVEDGFDQLVRNGTTFEIGEAPFIELEVFGQLENATLIYRESVNDPFTVALRGADGNVNGAMKVSGIRIIA